MCRRVNLNVILTLGLKYQSRPLSRFKGVLCDYILRDNTNKMTWTITITICLSLRINTQVKIDDSTYSEYYGGHLCVLVSVTSNILD